MNGKVMDLGFEQVSASGNSPAPEPGTPNTPSAAWKRTVPLLACPTCRSPVSIVLTLDARNAVLGHGDNSCDEQFPVIDDIPRLLTGPASTKLFLEHRTWFEQAAVREWFPDWRIPSAYEPLGSVVVSRFDREWAAFSDVATVEQSEIFGHYFDIAPSSVYGPGALILDAGCGAGRWAIQVAKHGGRVIALDAGLSVELAERNGRPWGIECVQADVTRLPFNSAAFDLVYSLGVLHHVRETDLAAAELTRVLRPGGLCLLYLYYALDNRGALMRAVFRIVDMVRRVMSRSPQPILSAASLAIALCVYVPLAKTSGLLRRAGLTRQAAAIPLGYYADRSFRTMRNDSLDRFGTRLEKRYTRVEIIALMERAGLVDITVSESTPYWHAIGRRAT